MDYATIVDQAVKEFYLAGNNEAHSWLLQAQASPEAWKFVWELLDPSKSGEVQFFAATTLHTKIIKQWDEVPEHDYPMLRDYLVKSLKQPNTPKFVLLKLCQAFAAFMVNSYNIEKIEEGTSIVDDLFNALTPTDSQSMLELLLRVLSLLPAECDRRRQTRGNSQVLIGGWPKTLCCLRLIFSSYDTLAWSPTFMILGLECTLAWFKTDKLPLEAIGQIYSDLLIMASHYAPTKSSNLSCTDPEHDRGWDIVQECLIIIVTHRDLKKWPQTLWEWARVLTIMAKEHDTKYFCEVLTAVGETHSREFLIALAGGNDVMHKQTATDLIELLLECTSQPGRYPTDETRSCIPFGFWYALQDDLATLDQPLEKWALLALKPIYTRLAEALLHKSTLPCRQELSNANERELFRCYRQDVADTLDYCYKVLQEDLLKMVLERLARAMCDNKDWTDIEASLHAFKALAEAVGSRNVRYVSEMIYAILSYIPYDRYPPEVMACACSALGAFSEWIGEHPDRRLKEVLQFITLGLTKGPAVAPFASMALKDVVRECGDHLAPFAPSILNTIRQTLPNVAPGSGETLRLMYAAGKVLNTLPTMELQLTYLDATLGLCIVKLKELLEQPLFVARPGVTSHLKMIVACLSTLEGTIGKAVLDGLIPLFHQIIAHPEWSQDNATLEAMYLCAQRSIPSLLHPETDARPLLSILTTSYKTWPHPEALNLLRHLIALFGRDQDNVMGSVLAEISSITLSGVKACKSVQGDLSDWSDLMEAYLGVLAQICKKNIRLLLQIPDQIPDMLQCGIACLTLPEIGAVKTAGNFLYHAITQSPHLQTFIQPIGQELVTVILHHISGTVLHHNLEPYAEVLLALNKNCLEWHELWLRVAFESLSDLAALRKEFITRILRERIKNRLCEVLKELKARSRPKMGTLNSRNDRTFTT